MSSASKDPENDDNNDSSVADKKQEGEVVPRSRKDHGARLALPCLFFGLIGIIHSFLAMFSKEFVKFAEWCMERGDGMVLNKFEYNAWDPWNPTDDNLRDEKFGYAVNVDERSIQKMARQGAVCAIVFSILGFIAICAAVNLRHRRWKTLHKKRATHNVDGTSSSHEECKDEVRCWVTLGRMAFLLAAVMQAFSLMFIVAHPKCSAMVRPSCGECDFGDGGWRAFTAIVFFSLAALFSCVASEADYQYLLVAAL